MKRINKAVLCGICLTVSFAARIIAADIGVYNASLGGGRSLGEAAIVNTLTAENIKIDEFSKLSLDNLLQYRLVILPNTRRLAQAEDPRWSDNLRAYVTECGGTVMFCHDAVGAARSPFGKLPLFPEIVTFGSVERNASRNVKVVFTEEMNLDVLSSYTPEQPVTHMYSDHFMFDTLDALPLLADFETGKTVVAIGSAGQGRVVFNGLFGAHPTSLAAQLTAIDRDILLDTVKWCLAGKGLVITNAAQVQVREWRPLMGDTLQTHNKIALIGDSGYDINHRARLKISWCGLKHDFIPWHFLNLRDLTTDDYKLIVVFAPNAWEEAKIPEEAFAKVGRYLQNGGKGIIFLPNVVNKRTKTAATFLTPIGSEPAANFSKFNSEELRAIVWKDSRDNLIHLKTVPYNNFTPISEPSSEAASVIAHWFDYQDVKKSPAAIKVPFGYILNFNYFDDHRLFTVPAAMELLPDVAPEIYEHLLAVFKATRKEIKKAELASSAEDFLVRAEKLRQTAGEAAQEKNFLVAGQEIVQAEAELVKAYAVSMPSPEDEERLVCLHINSLPDPEIACARLAAAGFNGIQLFGTEGHFPSALYNRPDAADTTDWLQKWIETAHRHGLKIGPVLTHSMLLEGSEAYDRAIAEDWRVVPADMLGKQAQPFKKSWRLRDEICRAHPELINFALKRVEEIIKKYPIDHLALDYIRWSQPCYCAVCKQRFQADTDLQVEKWPDDVLDKYHHQYNTWRAAQITEMVRRAAALISRSAPQVKFAAFLKEFTLTADGQPYSAQEQRWWEWGDYIDYAMPMAYLPDNEAVATRCLQTKKLLPTAGKARLLPAHAPPGSKGGTDLSRLQQIEQQREYAPTGITYFNYHALTDAYLELLSIGPWRTTANKPR